MKLIPDFVWSTVLSRISLSNCTCGAISEPNAAVAIKQPPPADEW